MVLMCMSTTPYSKQQLTSPTDGKRTFLKIAVKIKQKIGLPFFGKKICYTISSDWLRSMKVCIALENKMKFMRN